MKLRTDPEENLLGVGPADHQPDQVLDFLVRDPPATAGILPVAPDLGVDHVGQAQPPREGEAHVLVVQDLRWDVLVPECLQETECDPRMHPALPGSRGVAGGGTIGGGHEYGGRPDSRND